MFNNNNYNLFHYVYLSEYISSLKKSTLLIISKSDFHWKLWGVYVK